jgi:hypothetical protein
VVNEAKKQGVEIAQPAGKQEDTSKEAAAAKPADQKKDATGPAPGKKRKERQNRKLLTHHGKSGPAQTTA